MKKPEKKEEKETIISGDRKKYLVYNPNAIGYNQACDDWEKWLPSEEEIETLFNDYEWIEFEGRTVLAIHPDEIAKAISKRLGNTT